jgi:ketosteroid isomerase-like protein
MSTEENKQLMQQVFDELAKGNSQALVEAMADDVAWHITGTTKFSRTYSGKATLINELVGPLFSQIEDQLTMTADRFIADDNYVVVECRGKATTKTGRPYNNKYCFVFRVEDRKIKEVTEYMDTQLVVTAFES